MLFDIDVLGGIDCRFRDGATEIVDERLVRSHVRKPLAGPAGRPVGESSQHRAFQRGHVPWRKGAVDKAAHAIAQRR